MSEMFYVVFSLYKKGKGNIAVCATNTAPLREQYHSCMLIAISVFCSIFAAFFIASVARKILTNTIQSLHDYN